MNCLPAFNKVKAFSRSAELFHRCFSGNIDPFVLVETDTTTKITHIKLNRHNGKNSFSRQMVADFCSTLGEVQRSAMAKECNVVIVSSTVPKVFCAGADLKERSSMPDEQVPAFVDTLRNAFGLLEELPVPTIAAIEGAALGGGLELALCCDFRIASKAALLGLPETALAILPGAGGTQRLPRLIGPCRAKEIIFLAMRLSADEAYKYGVVNETVDAGQALPRAVELANVMAAHGPLALRLAKRAIDQGLQLPTLKDGLMVEKECYAQIVPTADRREGLRAFVEKRKPVYRGE
jgi:methylglutaconyl-CoA hydratase